MFFHRDDFIVSADPKVEGRELNIRTPSIIRRNTSEGTRRE